jgi:methylenetetrahydrofolate dehydrogenase (NADP+) / methenyltetrahydrofolate cyclohydrolase
VVPGLSVVLVGDDAASAVYVANKEKFARQVGMHGETIRLPASTTQAELLAVVERLNTDDPPCTAFSCRCRCRRISIPRR